MVGRIPFHLGAMANNIREGVDAELSEARKGIPFKLLSVDARRGLLTVTLESGDQLDPAMEEGNLNWKGEVAGVAEIISVVPDESKIHALLTEGQPPRERQTVWVNPAQYLRSLAELWSKDSAVDLALMWHAQMSDNPEINAPVPDASGFRRLRAQQRKAFELLTRRVSFLWGPPGTGKTHTLGRIIAAHVMQTNERILLLSTTNSAVDEAIISVQGGLQEISRGIPYPSCYRFGARFAPDRFNGDKEHLIPVLSKDLIQRYREHWAHIPDPSEPQVYKLWRDELNAVRKRIGDENRKFLTSCRMAAMTASYAAFKYDDLRACAPWDIIIFDEASQVSKAHAIMLAGLGHRTLFAGDPKQLSPIVQSDHKNAIDWVGHSPFQYMDRSTSTKCMLNEQSRMAPDICEAVSGLFYGGELRVAHDLDEHWYSERAIVTHEALGTRSVSLFSIAHEARPAAGFRGYMCPESAALAVKIAALLVETVPPKDVLIVTSYRAQRVEIGNQLKAHGLPKNMVSTVHRAQGSERLIVIIDPVRPSAGFLKGEEGSRLLNVAISRAKARLFLLVHPDHYSNPVIYKMTQLFKPKRADNVFQPEIGATKNGSAEPHFSGNGHRIVVPSLSAVLSLEEQFKNELLSKLSYCSRVPQEQKSTIDQVAYSPRFTRLTWAARDRIVDEVKSLLAPRGTPSSAASKKAEVYIRRPKRPKLRK